MTTLLVRLSGPMQSWGTRSRFGERDTERDPSKSGVLGLLCAAAGRPRTAPLEDLADLRMGVRVDREGTLEVDYQTAGGGEFETLSGKGKGVAKASGASAETVLSRRQYLADAMFLVGLEGDQALLASLQEALGRPRWPLFLGRKGYVPGAPVRLPDGLREEPLEEALKSYPPLRPETPREGSDRIRLVLDAAPEQPGETRLDVPLSFALGSRRFGARKVRTEWISTDVGEDAEAPDREEEHVSLEADP